MQKPEILSGVRLEQTGADRRNERRIIDGDRQIRPGAVAGPVPGGPHFHTIGEHPVVRCIRRLCFICRTDRNFGIEDKRADMA